MQRMNQIMKPNLPVPNPPIERLCNIALVEVFLSLSVQVLSESEWVVFLCVCVCVRACVIKNQNKKQCARK
jgi:hypothetical protein